MYIYIFYYYFLFVSNMLSDFYLSAFYFFILSLICSECWLRLMLDTLVMTKYKVLIARKIIVVPNPKSPIKTFLLIQAITLAVLWLQGGLILKLSN